MTCKREQSLHVLQQASCPDFFIGKQAEIATILAAPLLANAGVT
jgi:hypothetical protein